MKHLQLHNKSYQEVLKNFAQWLDILGFSSVTVWNLPSHLREFFHYLETQNIQNLTHVQNSHVKAYYEHLKNRPNTKRIAGLSNAYLNKHQQALLKFQEYLKLQDASPIPIHLKREKQSQIDAIQILTKAEIQALFKASGFSSKEERIQSRDRVILVLLYSCGLRRNEVIQLEIKDIFFEKQQIYVRKGKNYKERLVPINTLNLKHIEEYVYQYRTTFLRKQNTESLLLNYRGAALGKQSLHHRLYAMAKVSNAKILENKKLTPHLLRHSIATHLLEQGANIEDIRSFLGHRSLESTQLYTHILEQKVKDTKNEKLHTILRNKQLQSQKYPNLPKNRNAFYTMDA